MNVIYSLSKFKKYKKPVVALGVFDGVHLAHRKILLAAVKQAHAINGTSMVVTFWPHPQKENSIYSLEHRLRLLSELGLDVCVVIRFNKKFSRVSAEGFVKNILLKQIGAHHLYVGKNFHFGKGAKGNFKTLQELSSRHNLKLKLFDVVKRNNQVMSSTYIRRLINRGELDAAAKILGRPVSILGTVIKGASIGKRLGFPTANIDPHHEVIPPSGVYMVKVIFNNRGLKGICYIGSRPTFNAQKKNIEVYIFNFKKNIYGKYLEILFIEKIREDIKFSSPADLVKQIKKDLILVKKRFSLH
jgi:riboflavin kinase/FMN adenylyltransferase